MSKELISLQEAVREQIRETVMKAIPTETLDKIIADYFAGEFTVFVKDEIKKVLGEKLKDDIEKKSQTQYDKYGRQVVADISNEIAKSVLDGFANSIINTVMYNMKNNIRY